MRDMDRGRLFRIVPTGHKGYKTPKFDFSTTRGAAEALKNPNYATRYVAWTALHKQGRGAEEALLGLWGSTNSRHRARALWLLGKIEERGAHYVGLALGDRDANIRIVGIRLARQLGLDVIPLVQRVVRDESPQVRRECLIALRHNKSEKAPGLWAQLAIQHDGKDRWYLEALGIAADKQWDIFFAAWLKSVGDWNTPAGRDIVWRSRAKAAPALLIQIFLDAKTPAAERARYTRALDFHKGPEKDAALRSLLD